MGPEIHGEEEAWRRHLLEHERVQARLLIVLCTLLVPAWIPFDYLLEPELAPRFLVYRLADTLIGIVLLVACARCRTVTGVRTVATLKILSTGAAIGLMLPVVGEHYWPYLLGFSLLFWGTAVIISFPWVIVAAAFTAVLAFSASAMVWIPGPRVFEELVGGGFFIASMVVICLAQVALRGRLEHKAFLFAHRLADANERVQRSEAQKTRFFANVSHELRTPLTLILAPAQRLLEGTRLEDRQRDDLGVIVGNARVLLRRINDLLDVTRLELGQQALAYKRIDLARLVRIVSSHFDGLARQRNMSYVVDVPQELVADVDPDKIQGVLLNLLANAFKATPEGGTIRCTLRPRGQQRVELEVADSGPGIAPEHRDAIFERYRRLEEGGPRLSGTGLGLAIAKDFVQLHGGTIIVDDAAEGGASFRVEVPTRAAESPGTGKLEAEESVSVEDVTWALAEVEHARLPPRREEGDEPAAPADAPLILVVEDNPELNRFVCEALASDFRTASALDGRAGLDQALELRPDLIITDIMMPNMGGDELIAAARARPELQETPILVLSAREDDALRVRLLQEGARDYVTKPFSPDELRARVANLVDRERARALLQTELDTKDHKLERLVRDVTQHRRELETALASARVARDLAEQAAELKTNFLRMVSHELRSPLSSLLLQIQRLELFEAESLPESSRTLVGRMSRSALRLRDLIEGLLEYARIEGGRVMLHVEDVDMITLARDLLEELAPQAEAKGLALELETPSTPLPPLHSDPRLVRLIVVNLLGNAIKFTDEGKVVLRLGLDGGLHRLTVSDTGPGIPADQRGRVFEPFEQLTPVSAKHVAGVGLGLALVREMVQALGGTIDLESELDQGTTFTVQLPPVEELPAAAASAR